MAWTLLPNDDGDLILSNGSFELAIPRRALDDLRQQEMLGDFESALRRAAGPRAARLALELGDDPAAALRQIQRLV